MTKETTPEQTEHTAVTVTVNEETNEVVIAAPQGVDVQIQTVEVEEEKIPTKTDNALTYGLVGLIALVALVAVIQKAISNKKAAKQAAAVAETPAPVVEAPTAPGTAGQVKLYDVEPKTAAMLMAIVADKMGKPINELRFISIKEVK